MSGRPKLNLEKPKKVYSINVSTGFDIPTGVWVKGPYDETILNGGVNTLTAVTGPGNSFKSVIIQHLAMKAMDTIATSTMPYCIYYDSENNVSVPRLNSLAEKYPHLPQPFIDEDEEDEGIVSLTDKSMMAGDQWWKIVTDYTKEIAKSPKIKYPMFQKNGKVYQHYPPTMSIIDSYSKFEPLVTEEMMDKAKGEDGSTNMIFMKAGGFKTKALSRITVLAQKYNMYFFTTAHIGVRSTMDENKYSKPMKKLSALKENEELKKVGPEFYYLTKVLWKVVRLKVLKNKDKEPEYASEFGSKSETDLNLVTLEALRNKTGPTGCKIDVAVSQSEGVLEGFSYYLNLKEEGKFSMEGNDRFHESVFLPGVKMSKNTVRDLVAKNKKLHRALEIGHDILQVKQYHPFVVKTGLYVEPKELYEGLIAKGYDWDEILTTENDYTIRMYDDDTPNVLSVIDLFNMYHGKYTPYWKQEEFLKDRKRGK